MNTESLLLTAQVVVVQVSIALSQLGDLVDDMAPEQQVVSWSDSHGVSHENSTIHDQGSGHWATDHIWRFVLQVQDGSNWDPEIRYGTPEMCGENIFQSVLGEDTVQIDEFRDFVRHLSTLLLSTVLGSRFLEK